MPSPLSLVDFKSIGSYDSTAQVTQSIFNGTKFYYRPVLNKDNENATTGIQSTIDNPHHNDIYDTSINSILKYLEEYPALTLKSSDFAYLTDLGRYSNNRLVIARRFRDPVPHDLTSITEPTNAPVATMISWVPPEKDDFFNMTFGEGYESVGGAGFGNAFASLFQDIEKETGMNKIGGGFASKIGKIGAIGGGSTGLLEGLLAKIANEMGITDFDAKNLPKGDPNLIQDAMYRGLPGKTGGTLQSDFSIEMTVRYEQKFINNVDPTITFLDIIGNILRFGTSNSKFLLTQTGGDLVSDFFKKFKDGRWDLAIGVVIKAIVAAIAGVVKEIVNTVKAVVSGATSPGDAVGGLIKKATGFISAATISKYRIKINGIIQAMTGLPSVPWHVTIGNPKQPFFSSGDMVTQKVDLKFGNILGFNNLPSSIEAKFTLSPGRKLGAQEIFARFNVGGGRSYEPIPTASENLTLVPNQKETPEKTPESNAKAVNQGATKPETNPDIGTKTTTVETEEEEELRIVNTPKENYTSPDPSNIPKP